MVLTTHAPTVTYSGFRWFYVGAPPPLVTGLLLINTALNMTGVRCTAVFRSGTEKRTECFGTKDENPQWCHSTDSDQQRVWPSYFPH